MSDIQSSLSRTEPRAGTIQIATLLVVLAAIGFGTVPYFARSLTDAGMPPYAVAFYRYIIAAVVFLPWLRKAMDQKTKVLWGIVAGIVMGLGWIGYVKAIETAPIPTVGVIYMSYPVFTLVIGMLWFGDRPSRRAIMAATLILVAAAFALSPTAVSADQIPALLLSLGAPAGFGLAINVLVHKLVYINPLARISSVSLGAVLGLLPLMLLTDITAVVPTVAGDWWLVLGIALLTALVPQLIYTIYAPVIGAARSAMAGSVELPTMFVVGWLAFGESVDAMQMIACLLVIGAIVLTPARATRNLSTNMVVPPRRL